MVLGCERGRIHHDVQNLVRVAENISDATVDLYIWSYAWKEATTGMDEKG